jgi:hypothetical protein
MSPINNYDPPGADDGHGTIDNCDNESNTATTTIGVPLERKAKSSYSLILLLLNLPAAAYLVSQQSWHNSTLQIRRQLQVQMLQNELESSESQINILRYKMDALEHMLLKIEKGGRSRRIDGESDADGVVLDGQEPSEKLQLLEEEKQSAMDEFHHAISKLGLDADGYV